VLTAEAQAEEERVKQVKEALASEESAKHKATEITTLAQADLEAAAKEADAKKRLAEGVQAERAAPGIAEAKVQEAKAFAMEKEGMAEASVISAKGQADATAKKEIGMAEASVISATGDAEATAKRSVGIAGAEVTREQFRAEADGLTEKFAAMGTMSTEARNHEEFRMSLETAFKEAVASIEAGKEVAKENAEVLSQALQKAHIDIVGGEGHFFDTFAKSLSLGKAIDGFAGKSDAVTALLTKLLAHESADKSKDDSHQS
jgi:uncharacterized membrane protein YqiK